MKIRDKRWVKRFLEMIKRTYGNDVFYSASEIQTFINTLTELDYQKLTDINKKIFGEIGNDINALIKELNEIVLKKAEEKMIVFTVDNTNEIKQLFIKQIEIPKNTDSNYKKLIVLSEDEYFKIKKLINS